MKRAAVAVALLLSLAGCTGAPGVSTSPTPEAPAAPGPVDPNSYLVDGALDVDPDGDGVWNAYYAWYLDDSKSSACFLAIFSADTPSLDCFVMPGSESKATYALPADAQMVCDYSTANPFDGYGVNLGGKQVNETAGFSGCQEYRAFDPAMQPGIQVMSEGGILTVRDFTCTTLDAVTTCTRDGQTASITFGLTAASYTT